MNTTDYIFGIRAVLEAIEAGKEIDKILVKRDLQGELSQELFRALHGTNIVVQRVPVERINRVTMKNHQGVLAFISSVVYQHIEDIIPTLYEQGKDPFIMVLDGITDVRNFGAIARTCDCAAVDAIVIPQSGSVTVNADAIKTSAGALHTLPVCKQKSISQTLRFLQESGVRLVAATEKGVDCYCDVDLTGPIAIVMGAEDSGISKEALKLCDHLVSIPQLGSIASLNVSVAAGILLYESIRQKRG